MKAKSTSRIKSTGEIFTPPTLVNEIINDIYLTSPRLFITTNVSFLDPTCGDGEFLRGVIRKIRTTRSSFSRRVFSHIIKNQLWGVDIMWDNVCDTVYYLLRSYKSLGECPLLESSGFDNVINSEELLDTQTPEEINTSFTQTRSYKDSQGIIEVRRRKDSQHLVEYRLNKKGKWTTVHNIVRANSLTEWDFENWCCKCCKPNQELNKN